MNAAIDQDTQDMADKLRQLRETEAELERLREEIERRRPALQKAYAEAIKAHCEEQGWEIDEIVALLGRKSGGGGKIKRRWAHKDNPEWTYNGRGLPGWMRDDMARQGLDATLRSQREQYRKDNLIEVAA